MNDEARARLVYRVLVAGTLAGVALTPVLWGVGSRLFPMVPVFEWFGRFPGGIAVAVYVAMVLLLVGMMVFPQKRALTIAFLAVAVVLCLQDQMRWQPWLWQYGLAFAVFAAVPRPPDEKTWGCVLATLGLIAVGVYFWSGFHKIGAPFMEMYESELIAPWLPDADGFVRHSLIFLGRAVPYIEMVMAILLIFPRTRRIAVVLVWVMHLFIIVWLGPLGLKINSVVWPWNLCMMILVALLFWNSKASLIPFRKSTARPLAAVSVAVLLLSIVVPVFSIAGKWDRYLSFHLYSGHQQRMVIAFQPEAKQVIGDGYEAFAVPSINWAGLFEINVRQWALDELNVPPVDEDRVLLQVGKAFCESGINDQECFFYRDFPFRLRELGWDRHLPSEIRRTHRFGPFRYDYEPR